MEEAVGVCGGVEEEEEVGGRGYWLLGEKVDVGKWGGEGGSVVGEKRGRGRMGGV